MELSQTEMVLGWIGFGLAAALVAMILPYRRGIVGIATNLLLGILGALLGGVIGSALDQHHRVHDPAGLGLSAAVAVLSLGLFHIVWLVINPRERADGASR
jgi:uncharacterized membrane protein YeaQ/YmgE (transglycosylase-associated protein family)